MPRAVCVLEREGTYYLQGISLAGYARPMPRAWKNICVRMDAPGDLQGTASYMQQGIAREAIAVGRHHGNRHSRSLGFFLFFSFFLISIFILESKFFARSSPPPLLVTVKVFRIPGRRRGHHIPHLPVRPGARGLWCLLRESAP